MPVKTEVNQSTLRVSLSGEIDHHTVKSMREEIDSAIMRTSPEVLEIDMKKISFMDSSGIGLVMGRYRLMKDCGGKIVITGATGKLQKIMRIGGLEKIAEIKKEEIK